MKNVTGPGSESNLARDYKRDDELSEAGFRIRVNGDDQYELIRLDDRDRPLAIRDTYGECFAVFKRLCPTTGGYIAFPRVLSEFEIKRALAEHTKKGRTWIKSYGWEIHLLQHARQRPPVNRPVATATGRGRGGGYHAERWHDVDHRVYQEILRATNLRYGGACFLSQDQFAERTYYSSISVAASLRKLARQEFIKCLHKAHGGPQCPLGEKYHMPCNRDWYTPVLFCGDCVIEPPKKALATDAKTDLADTTG